MKSKVNVNFGFVGSGLSYLSFLSSPARTFLFTVGFCASLQKSNLQSKYQVNQMLECGYLNTSVDGHQKPHMASKLVQNPLP